VEDGGEDFASRSFRSDGDCETLRGRGAGDCKVFSAVGVRVDEEEFEAVLVLEGGGVDDIDERDD